MISSTFKALVDRPGPPDGLLHPTHSSFPSGHAACADATLVAAVLLFTNVELRHRRWWWLAAIGTLGMVWSRTYLQVHWLIDVLAGSLLGASVALFVFGALQLLLGRA